MESNTKKPQRDECCILVKAQPHKSSKYEETVCCAGIGRDGRWRRQYPIPFRVLADAQKFGRWEWIEYDFVNPRVDKRKESQKVDPDSISSKGLMKPKERADFLSEIVLGSTAGADARRDSLTLIRPREFRLSAREKPVRKLEAEKRKHQLVSDQLSFLHRAIAPLEPCPKIFRVHWVDQDGHGHIHECDDWETNAAFARFSRDYGGDENAVRILQEKYYGYFEAGLVLAFSTHSRRNLEYGPTNQWLLVGLIRLDESRQSRFEF